MMGLMLTSKERQEMEYLLKKELEQLLLDLDDKRVDGLIRKAMAERYKIIFKMYARFVSPRQLVKYMRRKSIQL